MLKIKALNQESSSDEDVPTIRREAQEEIVLELYNNALRAQVQNDHTKSTQILTQLLKDNIPQLENNGGLPKSMSTLKYSCYVNLGNIYLEQNNINEALESFTNASELDSTDVTLWAKIGKLALKEDKFNKAAYAFSKGLECSESHWPCLDNLISVLYAIRDTISCLVYIGKALMLDSGYIKGIVLKRQIYRDNPATKEYYQLYNPEHIWEPSIDVEVEKEEEEDILKEAQLLSDRVTEVEKSLGPKPLQTIPLPKALEDYTWLSLTRTIIYCHQYITDNNMSYFTFFDMNRCMSNSGESSEAPIKLVDDASITKENRPNETKSNNSADLAAPIEKTDVQPTSIERRFSQNSENTIGNDNTPTQTDNDEEQNMEMDNDNETDGDNTDAAQLRKKGKRKRDVLSDLQIWGWHSKRKPPKKQRDFTVEDALNRIIPKSLLKTKITNEPLSQEGKVEDSMNTMDIYNMYIENKELNFLSPIHSPKSVNFEAYFGTDRERDDVQGFWLKERLRIDAVILVKELVFELSKLWRYKWPKELVPLYVEAFKMFREHYDQPQPFNGDQTFEEIRPDVLATLLYAELLSFSSETFEMVHPFVIGYLQIISSWSDQWKEEYSVYFIRSYWLQSHCFRKGGDNELAIRAMEAILGQIDSEEENNSERFSLSLPNCFKYGFISRQIIEKIIKHLNMIISLGNVEALFNSKKYSEVADILKQTFHSGTYSKVGQMGRPAQLGILMHSLWFTDWDECFVWTEECLNEAVVNCAKPNADGDKWELIIEKCLGIFQEIIRKETVSVIDKLAEEKRCRLVESLVKIVRKQLNTEGASRIPLGSISAWILLHYVLLREEHRQYANKRLSHSKRDKIENLQDNACYPSEEELPPSIAILFSAHEFLGPKGWCLTGNGELLHFILDTVLDRLDTPIFETLRDKIDIHIEQALFCLYLYPSKKNKISRHLVDHNVNPIPLTWERSFQLYQYYAPESLPEFNSYKSQSISADLEQLFKRIIGLVPTICTLHDQLPQIVEFINGKTSSPPDPVEFPGKIRAIYYLLGDYYFKEKEFDRCIKYFQLDLCINPLRLDSWASLGLSYVAQLENTLNYCEKLKNETDFFEKAKSAQVCFRKALELDPSNVVLWIECGSFEYMVHSFCSRLIKYESENFSMEKFELLESEKESYLDSSGKSLEHAIQLYEVTDSNEPDERWLQYYILGKIAEKKRKEPPEYLQYYMTAGTLLNENNATYPNKINYNNPQPLSVEALELHYRIHASILKYLELHEGKEITNHLGAFFKKCLSSSVKRYTAEAKPSSVTFQEQFLNSIKNPGKDGTKENGEAELVVKSCLEDLLVKVGQAIEEKEDKTKEEDVVVVETDDVIMIISDSDDEAVPPPKHSKMEVDEAKSIMEDVQSVLDKMMEETMKDTGKTEYLDLNNSGTEQAEEVVAKEGPPPNQTDKPSKKASAEEDSSSSSSSTSSDSSSSDSDSDDSDSSSNSSSSESSNENMTHNEILQLVDKCIQGLETCIVRLPQNYKALYRLAHVFFNYKGRKDYTKCKQLLLGEYKCKDEVSVTGLFSERNTKNFFNGIWRIPSTEIDRPGSLAAHMNRCISLVLQVLRNTNDSKTLIELCMQLKKIPDRDKIYIKDSDRMSFSKQAMDMCVQSFRGQIKSIPNMQAQQITRLMHDIFRAYQRVQKHVPNKDTIFANLLVEAYRKFNKDLPENVNFLDAAIRYCQQHKFSEKQRVNSVQVFACRGPGMATPPVHPAPSTLTPKQFKPSNVGRPRGRPPLPKIPGQARVPRTKSPSLGSYPWQNQMFNYEYLKHYQDELIKQYSQNLTLSQLKHLTDFMASGQLNNPAFGQALANQFLTQTGLMSGPSTSGLLRPPATTSSAFLDPKKTFSPMASLTNLTSDQMKFLESMLPKQSSCASTTLSTPYYQSDYSNSKSTNSNRKSQEPVPSKSSDANIFMKDRPNISITPVGGSLPISSASGTNAQAFSKYKSPPKPSKAAYVTTVTETSSAKAKPVFMPSAFSKPVIQQAHATPKQSHSLPVTPPPVSSPSFMKTSPGKTLQEKLADKKKEQETKQMMKNIEADIYASKLPSASTSSAGLLKGLNIPSSLSVSPSAFSMPLGADKQPISYPKFPQTSAHAMPKSLVAPPVAVPKILPAPVYPPKFPAESGISISQIAVQRKSLQQSKTSRPISFGDSVEISLAKTSKPSKPTISVKKDLYRHSEPSSSLSQDPRKKPSTGKIQSERALSVIRNLSGIHLMPVNNASKTKSQTAEDDDVICID